MESKSTSEAKKHQLVVESSVLAKMWDSLCFRNIDVDAIDEKNMLVCDTTADRCRSTIGAWHIDSTSSRCVACNNYLDKNNVTKCQLVSACTVVEGFN